MSIKELINIDHTVTDNSEDWLIKAWRPYMGYSYMAIVLFDFIFGPIFWSIIQIIGAGSVAIQWIPLTLTGGGIFHVAMGAVLGISAFTRGQEKVQRLKTIEQIQTNTSDTTAR